MIPWRLISRSAVSDSGVNVESMDIAVSRMVAARVRMNVAADNLAASWRRIPDHYVTSHTTEAVGRVALVERSADLTSTALAGTISALNGLISDLEQADGRRASLLKAVDALRKDAAPFGALWLLQSELVIRNTYLWWTRDSVARGFLEALRRCDALLAQVKPDPFEDDPNNELTQFSQGRFDDVPLFLDGAHGVRGDQVRQGALGDCWLLATMASLADANPEVIRDMITDNGDGTYTVKLWIDGKRQSYVVDGDFIVAGDVPQYAGAKEKPNVLWPLVLEKAVAQAMGGYPEIEGDFPSTAMKMFLGDPGKDDFYSKGLFTRSGWHDGFDTDLSHAELAKLNDDGYVMTAVSLLEKNDEKSYAAGDSTVYYSHAYQVADVGFDDNGAPTVTVVNPWNNEAQGPGGLQVLTWDEFQGAFEQTTYAATS